MIISRTPVRLSFFGGGTDYREYFERKGGAVLGTTINKHTYVSVNRFEDFFEYKIRVGYSKSELVHNVKDILHPSVRETLKFKKIKGNLDIHIFSDLPARTGLGSSSSFTVGFLNALYAMEGSTVPASRLAREATHIEQRMIKETVGCQDQMHAAYGGMNIIEFGPSGPKVRPVVMTGEKYRYLNDSLMMFYTGQTRYASEVAGEQAEATGSGSLDAYLGRMHAMVFEAEEIISGCSPEKMVKKLGALLDEGWTLKKLLSSRITNELVDRSYRAAMAAGAYGGKLAGAGGGGFLFLIVPKARRAAVRKAVRLMEVNFSLESEGSKIIYLSER